MPELTVCLADLSSLVRNRAVKKKDSWLCNFLCLWCKKSPCARSSFPCWAQHPFKKTKMPRHCPFKDQATKGTIPSAGQFHHFLLWWSLPRWGCVLCGQGHGTQTKQLGNGIAPPAGWRNLISRQYELSSVMLTTGYFYFWAEAATSWALRIVRAGRGRQDLWKEFHSGVQGFFWGTKSFPLG